MKNIEQLSDLEKIMYITKGYLKDYLANCEWTDVSVNEVENTLEVNIRKSQNDPGTKMLRLGLSERNGEIYVYNLMVPVEDRRNGIGLGLINVLFQTAKVLGYQLVLYSMVDSFYNKMLERGAMPTNLPDCLVVTERTDLSLIP